MWNLPAPSGFQGLREDLPLAIYQRHLPHWRQPGASYFVTFRLSDSLPRSKLAQLARMKSEWERKYAPPRTQEVLELWARMAFVRVEYWLDQGFGACALRSDQCAKIVVDSLRHFDNERYELGCFVVMANHVHVIIRPFDPSPNALEMILKSWKTFSARRVNQMLVQEGNLWQGESHDRIIRDEEHLWRAIQYIGRNLETAGLSRDSERLWIRPEWELKGWTFEWRR